jgi:hypothetical protein
LFSHSSYTFWIYFLLPYILVGEQLMKCLDSLFTRLYVCVIEMFHFILIQCFVDVHWCWVYCAPHVAFKSSPKISVLFHLNLLPIMLTLTLVFVPPPPRFAT